MNETGEVVEQGTFDNLNVPGNYVHSLKVKLEEEKGQNERGQDDEDIIDKAEAADKVDSEGPKEEEADESRQNGGFGTYKYYLVALGPVAVMVFAIIIIVNAFLNGFQCRPALPPTENRHVLRNDMLTQYRCLGQLVG